MFSKIIMRRAPIPGSSIRGYRGMHELVALPYYIHGGTERIISQNIVRTLGSRDLVGIKSYITGAEYLELLYHIKKTAMQPQDNDITTSKIAIETEMKIERFKGLERNSLTKLFPIEFHFPALIVPYAIDYGYNIPEIVQNAILGENRLESNELKATEGAIVKINLGFLSETYITECVMNDHKPWQSKEIAAITVIVDSMLEKRSDFPGSKIEKMVKLILPSDITGDPQLNLPTFLEQVREDAIKFKAIGVQRMVHL